MPTRKKSKSRRNLRRGTPLTKEQLERRAEQQRQRHENELALTQFLSTEKKITRKELSPFYGLMPEASVVDVTCYADPVIQAFYDSLHRGFGSMTSVVNFDPKAEFERFINSYFARFSITRDMQKKVTKSRKGIGGRDETPLTKSIKEILAEAIADGEELDFKKVVKESWAKIHPTKPPSKAPGAYRTHTRDVRERLRRLAPQLLPKPRGGTKKRNG